MPGLLRGVVRTAAVAGTATAVSNRVSRRQSQRWAEQEAPPQQYAAPPQQYAAPPPSAAPQPAAAPAGRVEKLKDLADLKQQGILTEEEFAAEKARILGG
jgi:Short C-terminal domain